jgi:site-specific recombinase XerD
LLMVLYGTGMRRSEVARLEDRRHRQPAHGYPCGR